jgi:hypothetical protein
LLKRIFSSVPSNSTLFDTFGHHDMHRNYLLALFLLLSPIAQAQMVTGGEMTGFREVFSLDTSRQSKSYSADQLAVSIGGRDTANVLAPGEKAQFTFIFTNKTANPIRAHGKWEVIQYGTKGKPGDVWSPIVFRIAVTGEASLDVDLPANGTQEIVVTPPIPETFGGYALIADLGPEGRTFGASLVRVMKADPGRVQFPTYALDFTWDEFMNENILALFQKLGIKGARMGASYALDSAPDYQKRMDSIASYLRWAQDHDVTVMLTIDNGSGPQPLGRPRPWLSPEGKMLETKDDRAWLPAYDGNFQQWVQRLVTMHGWPKGPVNAVELWNEPWEGISISGWGADVLRFREIYEHMALGVFDARKQSGVQVLIGGACSSTNTRDKLFPDGSDKFLKWLDFVSIHYQPLAADPALVPEWMNRKGPYGRVKVWDTESWIANSDDRVAGVIASMRAQGQDRTAGIYEGNVYDSRNKKVNGKVYPVVQAWAPAAAVAATQKFIGQRQFQRILFPNGLPWVFEFKGATSADDGTLVVLGDLGAVYEPARTLFRSVKLAPGASLSIPAAGGKFTLYDFYGNPVPARGDRITVPLNGLGYFLRGNGSTGSFEALVAAVRAANITGYEPVEIIARDFTQPISAQPELRLRLTNVLNVAVSGELKAEVPGLTLAPPSRAISLTPHQTLDVAFKVTAGAPVPANTYPLTATFTAGGATVTHHEDLHTNVIVRRTPNIDGILDDWKGVDPQPVSAKGTHPTLTEEAWLPFKQFGGSVKEGLATAYLAYDDQYFYFAARVADSTPEDGMLRFETRNDDDFFYPEISYDKDKQLVWPQGVRRYSYRKNFEIPSGNGHDNVQLAFNVIAPAKKPFLEYPQGTMPHFMAYADTDYEFALNPVAPAYGGGTEVWRLLAPGIPRKHFYPRQPKAPQDGGPVKDAKLVCRREGNLRIVEAAIPWSELAAVRARLQQGATVKFTFRVNNNDGPALELGSGRSVSKDNPLTFHDDWSAHWANELEFTFAK